MADVNERMTSWLWSWRNGVAPCLPTKGLLALRQALVDDDPRLLQGCTTTPPPLQCVQEWPVEAACAVGYAWAAELGGFATEGGERNEDAALVGPTEEMFARTCFDADQQLGEPAACRWFLNFWDDTPREELFALMLPEVEAELARRAALEVVG
jgi:hypothetical protein